MRWQLKVLLVWCGVSVFNGFVRVTPGYAASIPVSLAIAPPEVSPIPAVSIHAQASPPPAATPPDSDPDRFLQPSTIPQPIPPDEQPPLAPTPSPPSTPSPSVDPSTRFSVQQIEVIDSTIFDREDFAPIVQPYEGQSVTLGELRQVADQITQLYLDGGHITSRAVLADQVVEDGIFRIRVIEGNLEQIEIEGNQRVNASYIRSRVQLGGQTPLNQGRLEDQLRLLRLDPLFENMEASLRAGSGVGQSILTVRVTEANPFTATFSADNYSPPSVGSERLGVAAGLRNVSGLGDELTISYTRSTTGGSTLFDFNYRLPVNPMNGTLQLRAAPSNYEITDSAFQVLDIEGSAELYELSFRQPLVRSPREELALSLGFTYRDGETLIADVLTDSSTTSVFKFGQEYVRRDVSGAWALRSQFNLGTELLDATTASGDQPDGQFFSWLGQVQRVQILNPNNLLIVQADLQLTPDPLLASQQFVLGGGQSLRGYRQNARLGDNGFRLSAENRLAVRRDESGAPVLQLAPFAEVGAIWNADNNPIELPDQTFLAGIGVGLLWQPLPRLNIRLDYALPLVDLEDQSENAQDDGFYFSVIYQP